MNLPAVQFELGGTNCCDISVAGLFQIVGPLATPSNSDLTSLGGSLNPEAELRLPPGRKASHSVLAGNPSDRKPSLEAQLQPVKSSTATKWRLAQSMG